MNGKEYAELKYRTDPDYSDLNLSIEEHLSLIATAYNDGWHAGMDRAIEHIEQKIHDLGDETL